LKRSSDSTWTSGMRRSFFDKCSHRTPPSKPGALSPLRLRTRSPSDWSKAHGSPRTLAVT